MKVGKWAQRPFPYLLESISSFCQDAMGLFNLSKVETNGQQKMATNMNPMDVFQKVDKISALCGISYKLC